MKNVSDLNIRNHVQGYYDCRYQVFQNVSRLSMMYDEEAHIIFVHEKMEAREYVIRARNSFRDKYPNAVRPSQEMIDALVEKAKQLETQRARKRENADFEAAVLKYEVGKEVLTVYNYLAGDEDGGSSQGVSIEGNALTNWRHPLVYRIKRGEYVLGHCLSGGGSNNSSCEARILSVLLSSGYKFWPSTMNYGNQHWKDVHSGKLILQWVQQQLVYVQLKWATAKKYKIAYERLQQRAAQVFNEACAQWGASLDSELVTEIHHLLALFGNVKEMKAENAALRMKHKLGGFGR